MENLDIIILTSMLSILFIVFGVFSYREISKIDFNSFKNNEGTKVSFIKIMSEMFGKKSIPNEEKEIIYKAIQRTISDMESEGLYFPEEVKEKLRQYRGELTHDDSEIIYGKSYEKI